MISVNKVMIAGYIGHNPDYKQFENGSVASISVATCHKWKDKNTGKFNESVEWHRVVFHNKLAETVNKYLHKGSRIFVSGYIKTRKYIDKSGIERYITEIIGLDLHMLDTKAEADKKTEQEKCNNNLEEQPQYIPMTMHNDSSPKINKYKMHDELPF